VFKVDRSIDFIKTGQETAEFRNGFYQDFSGNIAEKVAPLIN
jgi:hypothetical protein